MKLFLALKKELQILWILTNIFNRNLHPQKFEQFQNVPRKTEHSVGNDDDNDEPLNNKYARKVSPDGIINIQPQSNENKIICTLEGEMFYVIQYLELT